MAPVSHEGRSAEHLSGARTPDRFRRAFRASRPSRSHAARRFAFALLVPCLWILAPGGLTGQASETPPLEREGFWIGFGVGPANASIDCSTCGPRTSRDPFDGGRGLGFYLAMGGLLREDLLLGGEINAWGRENRRRSRDAIIGSVSLVAQYYPTLPRGLFLKGGAGIGTLELNAPTALIEGSGWSVQGGAGWDLRVGRRFAIVPSLNLVQYIGEGEEGVNTGQDVFGPDHPRFLHLALGFHWY